MDSSLRLECRMSSKPEHQSFIWTFYNQDGSELQVPNHLVESNGAASTLIHTLSSDEDLGTLECALNNMDNQFSQPCRFKIKKKVFSVSGVSSCSCFNQTFTSFSVSCSLPSLPSQPSPQSEPEQSAHTNILFQVFDAQTLKLVRNISSSSTQLTFTDLPASRDFLLQVLVEQDGIISEPFRTDAFTLRANDKQLAASTEKDSSNSARFLSIVGILVGIFSILALFSVALAVFLKKGRRHHQHFFQAKPNNCDSPTSNPDIIPNFNFPEDLSCKELVHEDWGKHNDQSLVLSGEDWGPPGDDWGQSTYSSFEPSIDTFSSGTQYASLQFHETAGALAQCTDTVGPLADSEKPRSPGSEKFQPPVQYSDINFTALQLATVRCGRNSNLRSSFSINDFPSEDQDSAVRFHSLKPKRKTVKFQDELNNPSKDTKNHICPHLQKSRTLSMSCRAPKDHDMPLGLQVLQPQVQVQVPDQGYFVTQDLESKL
ncbi:uncharacterized protein LOC111714312 isoform X2 [Eurytemora carolleeae]|uniref:uncharacterized protein LOC111714312 isoform X2 n=1 Tax=Eurytemora carolleeae TaxID=1294199 RepID=UPI000C75BFDC|nr:uncharacterized protein LOC111714312 isoform X2 [Eurytemora carolleeae]|eukprot:XP_023345163.1 uncharacterized protein LOC111714312 isoform X2 [Eurytemora affinis]